MNRVLALLLTGLMVLFTISAVLAQNDTAEFHAELSPGADGISETLRDKNELNVAGITPTTGNFFSSLWSNVTSDMDVRMLLHGYDLVDWHFDEGGFKPNDTVVSGFAVSEDKAGNRTYHIALHNDLYYSDGSPITAWDYAFSTLLTMSPEVAEIGGDVKQPAYLLGYEDYISGNVPYLAGFRVMTDYVFAITVSAEYLPFFYELGLLDCIPYPISVIAPGVRIRDEGKGIYLANIGGGDEPVFSASLLRKTILDPVSGYMTHPAVTSGPYRLISYENGKSVFEINEYYKGDSHGKRPSIPRLTYQAMQGEDLIAAYESGEIDLLNKITMSDQILSGLKTVENNAARLASVNYPRTGLAFLSFATERKPVDDVLVRQAIAYQLDKDVFISETVGSFGQRTDGYYGLGQWMVRLLNGTLPYPAGASRTDRDEWQSLSIKDIPVYKYDPEKAVELLEQAGWNLNAEGEPFNADSDTLRYKMMEEVLTPLRLSLAYPENTAAAAALEKLAASMAVAGMEMSASALPLDELLSQYYGMAEREFDLFFLSSNFDVLFDPSADFVMNEDGEPVWKVTNLADRELYDAAVAMRQTKAGKLGEYCRHWMEFQTRFSEILPMIPLYTNVYYDFYPRTLRDYDITVNLTWSRAVVQAYID